MTQRRHIQAHLKRLTILTCLLLSVPAAAQTWPSHLIKATIPFGAGSATDVVPRMVFERLSTELGQTIVVENRAGAGGTVGTAAVIRSDPDGYSILAHSSAITIAPAIFTDLTYDATKDLSSALMIGYSANVMITSPSKPWKTAQEFIEAAKKKDASITFGLSSASIAASDREFSMSSSSRSPSPPAGAPSSPSAPLPAPFWPGGL